MNKAVYKLKGKVKGFQSESYSFQVSSDSNMESGPRPDGYANRGLAERVQMLESALQKTREESFRAGYEEGKKKGILSARETIEQIRKDLETSESRYLEALQKMEEPLLELAKKMAEKVVGLELKHFEEYGEVLKEQLQKLLAEIIDQNKVLVKVNPAHLQKLNQGDLLQKLNLPDKMEINFVGDRNLKPGECAIQTEDYFVDGTFSNQIEQLRQELMSEAG